MSKTKVLVLGPQGTNSHEAANEFCRRNKLNPSYIFCETNTDVLMGILAGKAEIAIVPIENSSAGLVSDVVRFWIEQALDTHKIGVIGEVKLKISHNLISSKTTGDVSEVTRVISHPQALAQCARYLSRKKIKILEPASSTAEAVRKITESAGMNNVAAIGSLFAAELHNLHILKENIQDHPENTTRFHVISQQKKTPRIGLNRVAVTFWLRNEAGALVRTLGAIGTAGLNMSTIHSIPLGNPNSYAFYVEFEENDESEIAQSVLTLIKRTTQKMIVMGWYPI